MTDFFEMAKMFPSPPPMVYVCPRCKETGIVWVTVPEGYKLWHHCGEEIIPEEQPTAVVEY